MAPSELFCGDEGWGPISLERQADLTPCFEATVVSAIPQAMILFFGAYRILVLLRTAYSTQQSLSALYAIKILLAVAILSISATQLGLFLSDDESTLEPDYILFALIASVAANTFALILHHFEYIRSSKSSPLLLMYWLMLTAASAIELRTNITIVGRPLPLKIILDCVLIGLYVVIFAVENIPKPESAYTILDGEEPKNPNPETTANFFSVLTFWWMNPLMVKGYYKTLELDDLWDLSADDDATNISEKFQDAWEEQKATEKPWLTMALANAFGGPFLVAAFFKLAQDCLAFVQPQLLKQLITFIESYETAEVEPYYRGYFLAVGMFVTAVLQTIMLHQYFHRCYITGMRFRGGLVAAVYRKALCLSNDSRQKSTVGAIVNHMSTDAQRIQDLTSYLHIVWSGPLQIALALYFLYETLGPSIFAGLFVMILMIPLNAWTAMRMKKLQQIQMGNKDRRIKMTDEILTSIKVIKLYAWERSFLERVFGIRESELSTLRAVSYLSALQTFTWTAAPFLVSLASFAFYVLVQKEPLTSEKAFVSLSLFNLLQFPLAMLPQVITSCIEASVAINRIHEYLLSDELNPDATIRIPNSPPADNGRSASSSAASLLSSSNTFDSIANEPAVIVSNSSFSWSKAAVKDTLHNLNFQIKPGTLVAVVGQVGSGKSSLISGLLGELEMRQGHVQIRGQVAYVPQQAWICNATVQENILFGKPLNTKLYQAAISCCALQADIEMLPAGDQTEIGEKGINLSGGQKQRVSLARAFYSQADVYVLDDPLSAVDAHVGRHIFDNLVGPRGVLRRRTRILVTHGMQFLNQCDTIIVMKDGSIAEIGSYDELIDRAGGVFSRLIEDYGVAAESNAVVNDINEPEPVKQDAVKTALQSINQPLVSSPPVSSTSGNARLIAKETSESGDVNWSVYKTYFSSMGNVAVISTLVLFALGQGSQIGSSLWLTYWSDQNSNEDIGLYLGVYAGFGFVQSFFVLCTAVICLVVCGVSAARHLHEALIQNVLRAPMSFFDTTPLGRVVNRFSKDIYTTDETLPRAFQAYLRQIFNVAGIIIIISYSTPLFLVTILPLGGLYYFIQRYFLATSRELKRLDSVSRSPVYAHFSETLAGVSTIRAFQQQSRYISENEIRLNVNQKAYYPTIAANRWLAVRLEFIGALVVLFAALFAVIARETIDPGDVGLSVSYALSVTQSLNWMVRMSTDLTANMVSVERIVEYIHIPNEAPFKLPDRQPPAEWPSQGVVRFSGYSTRYRQGLDLVLKNINFITRPQEKIGVVGRTGAGKSSLTLALFRIIESVQGFISIDDNDISQFGLHDVRSRLTILPQDCTVFAGTVRDNLDPFHEYSEEQIWSAIEHASLKSFVSSLQGGLEAKITQGGENCSMGQRQLMCLARALLRKTRVLVLDEATAAVDVETDEVIQKTIRREFSDCTIFTIAHRINTVMDSDRILVLGNGEVKEFDTVPNLLSQPTSLFYGLVKEAGLLPS